MFKHKSEKYWNVEIAQGILGNYALVTQTCSIRLLCVFDTRHWHREKIFDPFFPDKNIVLNLTLNYFLHFFMVTSAYDAMFRDSLYKYFCAKHIKSV